MGGGGGGVMNWKIGIDIYILICIKWITNKNLLYKKINKIKSKKKKEKQVNEICCTGYCMLLNVRKNEEHLNFFQMYEYNNYTLLKPQNNMFWGIKKSSYRNLGDYDLGWKMRYLKENFVVQRRG